MDERILDLYSLAMRVREKAYAPFSRFAVGAAIESADGQRFTGCNVENSSYGLSNCAERVAVQTGIAAGVRQFNRIVVVANPAASPCGACRQVLAEFMDRDAMIYAFEAGNPDNCRFWTADSILPDRFRLEIE